MNIAFDKRSELTGLVYRIVDACRGGGLYQIATSGTTGQPTVHAVNLRAALEKKKPGSNRDRWLLTYSPQRWAGVSVVLHVMKSQSTLIIPDSLALGDILAAGTKHRATHIGLTPSLLKSLLLADGAGTLASWRIRQVTFGGEAVRQSVLDLAAGLWPGARITHVYASTEQGDICAVSDGLAGVPAYKFSNYRLSAGELLIDGQSTGDLWELIDGRYYFIGRKAALINVGGNKVNPLIIEDFAVENGAQIARAYPIKNAVIGYLVGLEYVGEVTEQDLLKLYRDSFPKYMVPVVISKLAHLALNDTGKIDRRNDE